MSHNFNAIQKKASMILSGLKEMKTETGRRAATEWCNVIDALDS